ncbi:MAG: hypothetical protein ABL914_06325 [Novosphingobium sp.]|uniref:hypothetical protein n=1 Tax=Novosphingobium sp. TaxID=1874826 RepID=UPI0032BC3CDB
MHISPELQALRSNDAPQRHTQSELLDLLRGWFGGQIATGVESQFQRFAQGEALTELPALSQLFAPGQSHGSALVDDFTGCMLAFLRAQPLGMVPLRHRVDDFGAALVLCRSGGSALALHVAEGPALMRRPAPLSVTFTPGETHELVLAGAAKTSLVTLDQDLPGRAELGIRQECIAAGDVMSRDGARECQIVQSVSGALVSLKLQRRNQDGALTREFALDDGKFLRQAAGSPRETRLELAAALLGRMGRSDAAPLLAAIAQEEASQSLRWQALRECLGLETSTGFSALCTIAEDAADPLSGPAGALRAQLLETYPVLQGITECRV